MIGDGTTPRKRLVAATIALWLAVLLAGCIGGGGAAAGVTIDDAPDRVAPGETINVTWSLSPPEGTSGTIDETALHWSTSSVPEPSGPEDYDERTGSVSEAQAPGTYNASIIVDENTTADTIYIRARATLQDEHAWSSEVEVTVSDDETDDETGNETVEVVTVAIGGTGPMAGYDPDPVRIEVGQAIEWTNEDSAFEHSATADDDAPESFDTGAISPGETSDPINFTVPGEYPYHDSSFPDNVNGTVIVEDPDDETGNGTLLAEWT